MQYLFIGFCCFVLFGIPLFQPTEDLPTKVDIADVVGFENSSNLGGLPVAKMVTQHQRILSEEKMMQFLELYKLNTDFRKRNLI